MIFAPNFLYLWEEKTEFFWEIKGEIKKILADYWNIINYDDS